MGERPRTAAECRAWDRRASLEFQVPSVCLMENAGAGAARLLLERWPDAADVLCLAGPGSNGGDAYVVARHLDARGVRVRVSSAGAPSAASAPDAAGNRAACAALGIEIRDVPAAWSDEEAARALEGVDVVVDGLFGTGLTRPPSGPALAWIRAVGRASVRVLALDVPSGLECDTGAPLGACVRADVTATFAFPKAGFTQPASRHWTGDVVVVPLGVRAD